jgi:nucleoside-diphosphate-sugar epimerase
MKNLVIGNTSQLAHYFPDDYVKISSRNIDFNYLQNNKWDNIYITFSEQRIYEKNINYIEPNYTYTLNIIKFLLNNCNKILCYSSCELWSNLSGYITTNTEPNFNLNNEYTISKLLLLNKIKELRKIDDKYNKVVFIHPFYFNSVYRSDYFLFGKIFNSILNKKNIEVGSLNFYRDMVHGRFVVEKSIEAKEDTMVGSGKLFNVKDFVMDLYKLNNMDFNEYVTEAKFNNPGKEKLIMAKVDWDYSYKNLLDDTMNDIESVRNINKG